MLSRSAQSTEIIRCFDQLALTGTAPVLVAISGGSDSTALLVGLQAYFKRNKISAPIVAVTIDHGLRPEAVQEAEQVGDLCNALGIEHIVRKWEQTGQSSGIQAAARAARYALIGEVARDLGAQFVLTGHTLDDQLETIAMRSSRGQGRGLAGIPIATLFNRTTWFVRPLLGTSRSDLRAYLSSCGISWVDDPSNDNMDFERVRVRQNQFSAAEQHQILGVQSAAQLARETEAIAGAIFILDEEKFNFNTNFDEGRLSLNSADGDGFEPALQSVMSKISRRSHFASSGTMKQILDFARTGRNSEKFTAHGCLLAIDAGTLVVSLEGRAKSDGIYCFDYLLPNTDFALANALNSRLKRPKAPLAPIKVAAR